MTTLETNRRDARRLAAILASLGATVDRVDANSTMGVVYLDGLRNVGVTTGSVFNGSVRLERGLRTIREIASAMIENG